MRKYTLLAVVALIFTASLAHAQLGTSSPTNNLSVTVGAEAGLTVDASTPLTSVGTNFANYTGTTNMTYFIRTKLAGGSGFIKLQVTTDFAPAGGPSVGTPPSAGDLLTYGCTVAAPGTACTGPVTALTSAPTSVATFGTDAHSAKAGNAASVAWILTNDPVYKTGAYSATVTFTISAS